MKGTYKKQGFKNEMKESEKRGKEVNKAERKSV